MRTAVTLVKERWATFISVLNNIPNNDVVNILRSRHLCWAVSPDEVLLLGGKESPWTTELVRADGSQSEASFTLARNTQ